MDPPASFSDSNSSTGLSPSMAAEGEISDMAAFMQNHDPSGQRRAASSLTPSAAMGSVRQHQHEHGLTDDEEEDVPMMMDSPLARPHGMHSHGSSTMQDLYRHHQQRKHDEQHGQSQSSLQYPDELQGGSFQQQVDYHPIESVEGAVSAVAARLPRMSSDETSSRYASVSTASQQQFDARPNLKKEPEEHSSTRSGNDIEAYTQSRPSFQGPQYQSSPGHHSFPPQMPPYNQIAHEIDKQEIPQLRHSSVEEAYLRHAHEHQHQQRYQQEQQEHERNGQTPPAVAPAESSHPRPQQVTDTRPYPRPGLPKEPATPAAEPDMPTTKLGRRCLAQKWKRTPDKTVAEVVVDGLLEEIPSRDSLLQMQCAGCEVLLQVPRTTLLVECPNCEEVHPAAKCILQKPAISRSTKSIPTYL
jgi:hypothetical protein